ncbi:hypothetical protein GCM10023084_00340 [Streptomyces lacrimifluminis]|uniref:Uncharacterized protein n=1 Tax=Streptomyces lacrimifluminis TaxID=1500077 RepID=A0A917KM04_9ACTN|nr:hypothetical protein [Streptomyces lacrimifluminis]GGJ20018.1 hypothetical protein GCM10012282_15420 [Streptomyces lacrimifluminis]
MNSSSRTNPVERAGGTRSSGGWAGAARNPWTVLCAVATVVLGPAAVTASALDQANAAPMHHHAVRADPAQQAYIPSDPTRRRTAA